MKITVVGAGVIGLVTALVLEERGHEVRVVAEETTGITSTVAGAIWFPYRAGPRDRVVAWAHVTRLWLEQRACAIDAGVDMLTGYEIDDSELIPWWAANLDVSRAPAPVTGAPMAWKYRAPRVEPAVFLPWLAKRFAIEQRRVVDLAAEPGDIIVNCTGLAARAFDPALQPLFGQVVITEVGEVDRTITITDDRDPDALFYLIPRRDELVLGGCSLAREECTVDSAITDRILDRARALGLRVGATKTVRAALRPYRPAVRLEREGRVIHNYGHGGAGYTLCRGCAEAVHALI